MSGFNTQGEWIGLAEAARRASKSAGHLKRSCPDWQVKGLAKLTKPASGRGRPTWVVHETADPGFARIKFAEQIGTDLRGLTETQRQTVILRNQILTLWNEAIAAAFKLGFSREKATNHFVQRLFLGDVLPGKQSLEVSARTLYGWQERYRAGGLAGLADQRGNKAKPAAAEDPFFAEVTRYYLTVRKLSVKTCHVMASLSAQEKGWEQRSYKACQRMIDKLDPRVVLKLRHGDEAYKNEAEPFIERDYTGLTSNQIWCGDHHQFDVIVRHGDKLLRPWLTAWQDMRSRKIIGWVIGATDPDTNRILAAVRHGILTHGVPISVLHDNGKDYDSYALHGRTKKDRWEIRKTKLPLDEQRSGGVFSALQVEVKFCWPYHGQAKPIERFFGTLEQSTRVFPTYCGNSPGERPEDLQLALERGKAPTLPEFTHWFSGWLDAYHQTVHSGQGMEGRSPDAIYASYLTSKRTTSAELLDVLMLPTTPPMKVTQNGVRWKGLTYGQYAAELRPMLGKDVILRIDDRDLSRVQVWTVEGKFVCVAPANAKVPFAATAEELRAAIAEKKADRRSLQDFYDRRPRMSEDLAEKLVRAKQAAALANAQDEGPPPEAPSLNPVRSTFEDQLPALQRALQIEPLKIAVGGEATRLVDVADLLHMADADGGDGGDYADPFAAMREALQPGRDE